MGPTLTSSTDTWMTGLILPLFRSSLMYTSQCCTTLRIADKGEDEAIHMAVASSARCNCLV